MPSREERRKDAAIIRAGLNSAKYRCLACEKANLNRNKEHFWPRWLIAFAEATKEPVEWLGKKLPAEAVQIPLCATCNSAFGADLEGPMSQLLPRISAGAGVTDAECELIVRWLWKFEGLGWNAYNFHRHKARYSVKFSLRDRVLGKQSLTNIRGHLVVALALAHQNDPGSHDWSLGIDSGLGENDAIFVSAVFRNVAMMVSLADFAHLIPPMFSKYRLQDEATASNNIVLKPETVFPRVSDAEIVTNNASDRLKSEHERVAKRESDNNRLVFRPARIEIPHPAIRTLGS
ncbi:MAG: hypothetical protein E5X07_22995 [Mesorhizobium sp.]|uniref:hypothetical protein n=1 Tax=Mesorhizobium sp. TaxID=1871066 RepID=UPI001227216B|nr:hypothetical protein [Mesorhizobium sp.]TIR30118.1 MAG: hypothetical protein E5X35_23910 [Mesorhizobium sp.]TIS21233.1 MAG: hypothetical protein E5X07_22995 [Mesorhizobium sp.]